MYRNYEYYPDPTAGLAICNVMKGNLMKKNLNNLIRQAKCIERNVGITYDYSRLTTSQLIELVDGLEDGSITERRLHEILDPIAIVNVRVDRL